MQKHKKRVGKKSDLKLWKIALLGLIILLIIGSIYGIQRYYSNQDGRVYEIISKEMSYVEEISENSSINENLMTGDSIFSENLKNVMEAMSNARDKITKENPLIPRCENVIDSNTGNFDILFIGDGYSSISDLKKDVTKLMNFDGKQEYPGLFSIEPFKEYKNKFDVRAMKYNVGTANINENNPTLAGVNKLNSMLAAKLIENRCSESDYIIVLSKYNFRSVCIPNLACLVSIRTNIDPSDGALVTHEFAHGFAGLADEYTDSTFENLGDIKTITKKITGNSMEDELDLFELLGINSPPNCKKPSKKGDFTEKGCGFSTLNYKPTKNSIMNNLYRSSTFNKESRERIEEVLQGKFKVLKSNSILKRI